MFQTSFLPDRHINSSKRDTLNDQINIDCIYLYVWFGQVKECHITIVSIRL